MSNLIKLKRGSGSDPQASDLVVGEVAVRTDTGKLFTKKDDNSVSEIGVTALGNNDVTTSTIADDAVTYAKIQNVSATNRILGRDSSGAGAIEEITPANLRTMINVEDGATADQTASDIKTLLNSSGLVNAQIDASAGIAGTKISPDFGSQNIVTTGHVDIADDSKLKLGDSDEFTIFHAANGSSYIKETGGGNLSIDATNVLIRDASGNNKIVTSSTGAAVTGNLDVSSGVDVTGNITVSGTVDGRDLATDGSKLDGIESGATADQTKSDIDGLGIAASTAATLATARTIAGVSFDGSANISLNNNAITNGAGYITATLTNEQVQDIIGGMLSGNTETGIAVTYQDGDGTIDFVVASQTDENFTTTLKNKLDGIAASATNVTNTNQLTNGAGFITATLTNEQVQDIVGGMVSGNTESGITVTYQDSDGTLDFSVASQTDNNFTTTLKNKLDGIAASATNVTNNNQLTNGAGYITSADGGNAATLDSLDSTAFLRSNAADTASELITLSGGLAFTSAAKCSAAVQALSDGSTITVNFTNGIHHSVTLGGNRTFGNPSNDSSAVGQSGSIFITQDGTGSRTASFHSDYKFVGGTAPTLSTGANAVDRIDYVIKASGVIHCAISLDVK